MQTFERKNRGRQRACIILATALCAGCSASSLDDATIVGATNITDRPLVAAAGAANEAQPNSEMVKTAGSKSAQAPALPVSSGGGYKIGPYDVLEISVFKVPELTKSVQVSDSGTINLPLVGEMTTSGLTAQDVERELTRKLGAKYLQSPQVSVFVKEFNSQRITIDGSVKKPGVFPYRSSVSLLQAIAMADGLDKDSDSTIVVFRTVDGKKSAARFDVDDIRNGKSQDPELQPGDTVIAGQSMIKTTFNNVLRVLPSAGLFMGL